MKKPSTMTELLARTLSYGAGALLFSQLSQEGSWKGYLTVSIINSSLVTVGQRLFNNENSLVNDTWIIAASLALTYFAFSLNNASLAKTFNTDLLEKAFFMIPVSSIIGEVVAKFLLKNTEEAPPTPIPALPCSEKVKKAIRETPKFNEYRVNGSINFKVMQSNKRPANLFFEALDIHVKQPGTGLFAIENTPEEVRSRIGPAVITAGDKKCRIHGRDVSMKEAFGEGVYNLSAEEVTNIMSSQRIHLSPYIPKTFYLGLKEAMRKDNIVVLPSSDMHAKTLAQLAIDTHYPHVNAFLTQVARAPASYHFDTTDLPFDTFQSLTVYQIGSMVVKTEDYHCFVGDNYQIANRNVGDKDQIHLINACGIRGFHQSQTIPGNSCHEIDRRIMKETYKVAMQSVGEGGFYVLPALGMGVWRGTPEVYWGAFFDAVLELDCELEQILVSPGHQQSETGEKGEEFGRFLEAIRKKHPDNKNLKKVIDLFPYKTDVVLLAKHLKAEFPDKVVGLQNASDPDVTLGFHVGEYTNNIEHPSTTEENYTANGSNGLNFESVTRVLEDESKVIAHTLQ